MTQRIVHVITRLLQGGSEENTITTCLHQARAGHSVTIVHGDDHPRWREKFGSELEFVKLDRLKQSINPIRDLRATFELYRLFSRLRPDILHTHQSKAGILARVAAALAHVEVVVHTVHIAPFLNVGAGRRIFYIAAEKLCARTTDILIAVSDGMRNAFEEARICRPGEVAVIHSGMPLDEFVNARPPDNWASRIGGWASDDRPLFVLTLASFEPRKRQREFLQAIAPRLRDTADLCFLFAGEGPELEDCKEAAAQLGISEKVRFLGHDDRPHELVALADLCVLTSTREGLPRSIVQYLAEGKPVLTTRLPGIAEIVHDGENGVVTGPDDIPALADRLFDLIGDEGARQRLMDGARHTDVSSWSEDVMVDAIDVVYAMGGKNSGSPPTISAIEFFGVPGAGKTTVARELHAMLAREGRRTSFSGEIMGDGRSTVRRTLRRVALVGRELARHPRLALRRAARLIAMPVPTPGEVRPLWNYWSVLAMVLGHRRRHRTLLVCDQGLVQSLWTQRMEQPPAVQEAKGLMGGNWFRQCLFVHVSADPILSDSRLNGRPTKTSRMQRSSTTGRSALWDRAIDVDQHLVSEVQGELHRRHLEERFIELSNNGDQTPTELASAILSRLREFGPTSVAT